MKVLKYNMRLNLFHIRPFFKFYDVEIKNCKLINPLRRLRMRLRYTLINIMIWGSL